MTAESATHGAATHGATADGGPDPDLQQRLYRHNRSVARSTTYAEIEELERRWILPLAAEVQERAPAFTSRREVEERMRELLRSEESEVTEWDRYLADEATLDQLRVVVGEFAVDGLVEAQAYLPIIPRLPSKSRMAVFRVLIDEFGSGIVEHEHCAMYRRLLAGLGMDTALEPYVEAANPESFAYVNLFHWFAARADAPEYFLGAFAYFESSVLYAYRPFAAACERLGVEERQYYTEHLYIDNFHSKQMIQSIRDYQDEHPVDLGKLWAGIELTSMTVAATTRAAVAKARRIA